MTAENPISIQTYQQVAAMNGFGPSFDGLDHPTKVAIHNNWVREHLNAAQSAPQVEEHARALQAQILQTRDWLDNNFPREIQDKIRMKYVQADLRTVGQPANVRAAERIAQFNSWRVLSDMDGTLTTNPNNYLEEVIPGSEVAEAHLRQFGRDTFPTVFSSTWRQVLKHDPQTFFRGGQLATELGPVRAGVAEFLEYAQEEAEKVTVVSANFEPFVYGVLDTIPNAQGIEVCAVREDNIVATDKESIIRYAAMETPDSAIIYIGDGSSDLPAMSETARQFVAVYFALENSEFAKQLKAAGIPHFTYSDFNQIKDNVREITSKQKERQTFRRNNRQEQAA